MGTGNPESVCVAECEYTGTGAERTALRHPARVSARSRPYSAQQIVPASETENAGFSGAGGRPLPDAPDALEVSQIARTIAKALRLNESLAEAIALGHDLGHTPFGHSGEAVLNRLCSEGFAHYQQSVRIVEVLEQKGQGLNLTWEVRNGILNHRTSGHPATLEGNVVRLSDKIAYINHDIDDAIRGKIMKEEDLPREYTDILGNSVHERLNIMIHDIIEHSQDKPEVAMSPEREEAMHGLRRWMFDHVYHDGIAKAEEGRAQQMVEMLYGYYMAHPEELPEESHRIMEIRNETKERAVCDYIAGMTDIYAIDRFKELFIPKAWSV